MDNWNPIELGEARKTKKKKKNKSKNKENREGNLQYEKVPDKDQQCEIQKISLWWSHR